MSLNSFAGEFVEKGMYLHTDMTIGYGQTLEIAKVEAEKVIPRGFEIAKNENSPAIQCTGETVVWNEEQECGNEKVRYVLPIRKVTR
jgi:hypothetical protein